MRKMHDGRWELSDTLSFLLPGMIYDTVREMLLWVPPDASLPFPVPLPAARPRPD